MNEEELEEYIRNNTFEYWVVCHSSACSLNQILFKNLKHVESGEPNIVCGPCGQNITDLGKMDTLEERLALGGIIEVQ